MEKLMNYRYYIYFQTLKNIKKNKSDIEEFIDILHTRLKKGLDKTAGKMITRLNGTLREYERIKLIKNNTQFRLIYKKEKNNNILNINIIHFEKVDNPQRKDSYPNVEKWVEKFKKNPNNYVFIPIKEYHYKTKEKLKSYFNDEYKYSLNLTEKQSETLKEVITNKKIISYVTGVPGAGKTVLGAEVAKKNYLKKSILIILPNTKLIKFYKNYLISNEVPEAKIITIDPTYQDDLKILENSITITTFRTLIKKVLPEISYEEQRKKAINALINIRNFFNKFENLNEVLDFYNAFLDSDNNQIAQIPKDALSKIYEEKIDQIINRKNRIKDKFERNEILTNKEIAKKFFKKLEETADNHIIQFINGGNDLFTIVDEVQDFIYDEWIGLVNYAIKTHSQKNTGHMSLLFLGDEKQRITVSGFSWTFFKQKLYEIIKNIDPSYNYKIKPENNVLYENFRVTKEIATFVEMIDEFTENNPYRHVISIKRKNCRYSKKQVNIIKGKFSTIEKAIDKIDDKILPEQKAIVITEEKINNDHQNIEVLKPYEAKGTEHENVILLHPFKNYLIGGKSEFTIDENYKLYTMATRSKNALTIILEEKEYSRFYEMIEKSNFRNSSAIKFYKQDGVSILEEIFKDEGLEELSIENNIEIIRNKINELINKYELYNRNFFRELNQILINRNIFTIPEGIFEIVLMLQDKNFLNASNFDDLNSAIEYIDNQENRKKIKIFWHLYNNEPIIALSLAKEISADNLAMLIFEKFKEKGSNYSKFLLHVYRTKDMKKQINFPTIFHEELFLKFEQEKYRNSENLILLNFHKNKISRLQKLIDEVLP